MSCVGVLVVWFEVCLVWYNVICVLFWCFVVVVVFSWLSFDCFCLAGSNAFVLCRVNVDLVSEVSLRCVVCVVI